MELKKYHWPVVIIGAGQSGLATGYFLKKMNCDFIILDKNEQVGDSWRKRWDSLKVFTPSQYNSLPGFPFPASRNTFPDKNEVADYLQEYASRFSLPVHLNINVEHLNMQDEHYLIDSSAGMIVADKVIVATGTHPSPKIPSFASELSSEIFQIHSSAYLNPAMIPSGDVLVVGAGTSGVEIAIEVAKTHKVFISGKPNFHIPDPVFRYLGRLYWWFVKYVVTIRTPVGRKAKEKILHGGGPLIRVSPDDLVTAGVINLPRLTCVDNGLPRMADGSTLNISTVIWATGFRPDFSWIEMQVTDQSGWPVTMRGISTTHKGLYFNGMPFQFGLTSGLIGGVGRDASYISRHILKN